MQVIDDANHAITTLITNSLMETVHLLKTLANAAHPARSIEQYRHGKLTQMLNRISWILAVWEDYQYHIFIVFPR